MSGYSIEEIRSLGDSHKTFQFKIIIAPLPGAGGATEKVLSMRCASTSLPEVKTEDINVSMSGFTIHEPGLAKRDGIWNVSFVESSNIGVRTRLQSWLDLCTNPSMQTVGDSATIKTVGEVHLLKGDNEDVYVGRLLGLKPISVGSITLSSNGNQATQVQASFSYDYLE